MERVYFHYDDLEEVRDGMWRIVRGEERKQNVKAAANLMRDPVAFEECMTEAVRRWPNSSLFNLCNDGSNRIAWLGHAGCCIGVGSPEENTRCAWHELSKDEQDEANRVALNVLNAWIETATFKESYPLIWIMER